MPDTSLGKLDELVHQTSCYGLPYGIFGIICWLFTTLGIALIHKNINLVNPLKWCSNKPFKSPNPLLVIIMGIMTVGPVIYTCVRCRGEWDVVLIALGQLTPWSFAIINDATKGDKEANKEARIERQKEYKNLSKTRKVLYTIGFHTLFQSKKMHEIAEKQGKQNHKNFWYKFFGGILVILLSISGWVGTTGLLINLNRIKSSAVSWVCIIYVVAPVSWILMTSCICCGCYDKSNNLLMFAMMAAYLTVSLHVLGSYVIIAMANNQWVGIANTGAGIASSIIFFIGKFGKNLISFH